MEQIDKFIAFLAYIKRILTQGLSLENVPNLHLAFKGFTPNKANLYDFKKYGYESFLTDRDRYLKTRYINYKYRSFFIDKYICYLFLKEYVENVVPVYGLIDKGKCFLLSPQQTLNELFTKENKFVLKPRTGAMGEGILVIDIQDEKAFLNGVAADNNDSLFRGLKDYILVPFVKGHEYSRKIFPKTLNTFRLLTCVLGESIEIIGAIHRFGSSTTGNVDNFSQGGISARIDVNTGLIDNALVLDSTGRNKSKVQHHPETNQQIVGIKIPHWEMVIQKVTALHGSIKFIKYIGWDIAITPEDFKIIEANHVSDVEFFQVHEPLLTNSIAKRFYSANI
jgi:hypothetical protein